MPEEPFTGQVQHAVQEHNQQLLEVALQTLEAFAAQLGPMGLPATDQQTVVFVAWETTRCGQAPENFSLHAWPYAVAEIGAKAVEAAIEASAYMKSSWLGTRPPPTLAEEGWFCESVDTCARAAANVGLDSQRCDELRSLGMCLLDSIRHILGVQTTALGEASETNSCSEDHSNGHQSGTTVSMTRANTDCVPAQVRVPWAPVPQPNHSGPQVSSHIDISLVVRSQSSREVLGSTNRTIDSSNHRSHSQLLLWDPENNRKLGPHTAGEVMKLLEEQKVSTETVVYGLGVDTGAQSAVDGGLKLLDQFGVLGALDREDRRHKVCANHEKIGNKASS